MAKSVGHSLPLSSYKGVRYFLSYLNLTFPQDERRPRSLRRDKGRPGILWDARASLRSFGAVLARPPGRRPLWPGCAARRTALADPLRTSKVLRLPGGLPPPPSLSARSPPGGSRCLPVRERRRNTSPGKVFRTTCSRERPPRPVAATTSVGGAAVLLAAAGAEYQSTPAPAASPSLLLIPQWRAASPSRTITDHVRIHIRLPSDAAPPQPHFRAVVGATRTAGPECLLLLSPLFLASLSSRRLPYSHLPFITSRC